MITRLDVFDRIATQLRVAYPTLFVTSERFVNAPKLPCLWMVEIDGVPQERYTNLDLSDSQRRSTFEVQAYSDNPNGATLELEDIIGTCETLFKGIGYRMIYSSPVDNAADTSIKRHICRFTRVIGDGDTLPIIPTNDDND